MNKPWTVAVFLVMAASGWMAPAAVAGEPRIDRVAPETSVVVASVKNCAAVLERAKGTKLWQLWQAPEMAETREALQKHYSEALKEMMKELALPDGPEDQTLPWPSGSVGFALFPVLNEELGTSEPAFIWFADYGQEAERAAALVDAIIKKGDESGKLILDEEDVLGRKVVTVKPKNEPKRRERNRFERGGDEEGGADNMDQMNARDGDDEHAPAPEEMLESLGKVYYVRDGSVLMASTDLRRLTRALESADGNDGGGPCIADSRDFQRVVAQLGEGDGYGVLMLDNLVSILSGQAMTAAMIMPMVKSIVGNVTAIGAGMRVGTGPAMVESTWVAHMPGGTSGISSLLDTATARAAPPPFIAPETIGYARVNFEFQGLPAVLRQIFMTMAAFTGEDPEAMMAAIEPELTPITSALGMEIHMASLAAPGGAAPPAGFYAIRCEKPADLQNYLAARAPMLQLEPRDFLGHRLYTMDAGMMPLPIMGGGEGASLSIGLGGSYVFVGVTSAVEQALRAIGGAGGGLADSAMFAHATAALPDGPAVAWGFTNVPAQIEAVRETILAQERMWKDMGMEEAGEGGRDGPFGDPMAVLRKLDTRMLQRYLGPASWHITSTGEGFVGKSFLLPPVD